MRHHHVRLLYLSYWSASDGLTRSTVLPHLQVLRQSPDIELLAFTSVERTAGAGRDAEVERLGVVHEPLHARQGGINLISRALDFVSLPRGIARICRQHGITRILARGAPAGALAHLMQKHMPVPYAVESFEPHARYMLESGVWSSLDPRYLFQSHWERCVKSEATTLLPVAEAYRAALINEGLAADQIVTLPCTVDSARFQFDPGGRRQARADLGIPSDAIVGIYVGKFGGIYYDAEAFAVFARFATHMPSFRMIVLTPMDLDSVAALARTAGYPAGRLTLLSVPHEAVARYLSAADVGFATVRMAPSRRFCSPVKVGEYLASGLPVVITDGIGDDSEHIRDNDAGAVIDLTPRRTDEGIETIGRILAEPGHRERIARLAHRFRSRALVAEAYGRIGLL